MNVRIVSTLAIIITMTAVFSAYAGFNLPRDEPVRVSIPTTLESTQVGGVLDAPGGLGVRLSPPSIGFSPVRPGSTSEPVELTIENTGGLPVSFSFTATAMTDATSGVALPASAIRFLDAGDASLVIEPGASHKVRVQLVVPSGADAYVPAGAYAGSIELLLQEVTA